MTVGRQSGRLVGFLCLTPLLSCGVQAPAVALNLIVTNPVATIAVVPAIVTLAVGGSQSISAVPKDASGIPISGTSPVFASSAPAVASVSNTGLVGAVASGSAVVTVAAGGQTAFVAVSVSSASGPTTPPAPTPPPPTPPPTPPPSTPPPPASGTVADPTQLPVVTGQPKNVSAYTALNVPSMVAGASYTDPVTGVKVYKVTSATVPLANAGMVHWYSEGPSQISREYGAGIHTIWIQSLSGTLYFVDHTRSGGLTNYRLAPSGAQIATFSKVASTPSIVYLAFNTGILRRYDVATNAFADTPPFPATFPGTQWLAQDMNDVNFIAIRNGSVSDVVWWNRTSSALVTRTFANLDEPYIEKNGRYVMANTSLTAVTIWDLQTNTLSGLTAPPNVTFSHVGAARGYFFMSDGATGSGITPQWALDPSPARAHYKYNNLGGYFPGVHHSGQWVQSDAEIASDLKQQWVLRESYNWGFNSVPGAGVAEGIAFLKMDGTQYRIFAHHYSVQPPATAAASFVYFSQPRTTIAIDGKLVMFESNMNGTTRHDVFLAEVPVR